MERASSGSRSRINSVEPLMSANSAVTVLRSNRPLGRWFSEWRRAPAAESEAGRIFGAAFRATLRQRSGAPATESHPLRIVEAAGVAAHLSRPLLKLDVLCLSGCFSTPPYVGG